MDSNPAALDKDFQCPQGSGQSLNSRKSWVQDLLLPVGAEP